MERKVIDKQSCQKSNYDKRTRYRDFKVGDEVLVKMHKKDAWKAGKIEDDYSFRVVLANGQAVHCYVDQLRRNQTTEIETPESLDDPEAVVPDPVGSDSTKTQDPTETPPEIVRQESPGVGAGVEGRRYPSRDRRPPDRFV